MNDLISFKFCTFSEKIVPLAHRQKRRLFSWAAGSDSLQSLSSLYQLVSELCFYQQYLLYLQGKRRFWFNFHLITSRTRSNVTARYTTGPSSKMFGNDAPSPTLPWSSSTVTWSKLPILDGERRPMVSNPAHNRLSPYRVGLLAQTNCSAHIFKHTYMAWAGSMTLLVWSRLENEAHWFLPLCGTSSALDDVPASFFHRALLCGLSHLQRCSTSINAAVHRASCPRGEQRRRWLVFAKQIEIFQVKAGLDKR